MPDLVRVLSTVGLVTLCSGIEPGNACLGYFGVIAIDYASEIRLLITAQKGLHKFKIILGQGSRFLLLFPFVDLCGLILCEIEDCEAARCLRWGGKIRGIDILFS